MMLEFPPIELTPLTEEQYTWFQEFAATCVKSGLDVSLSSCSGLSDWDEGITVEIKFWATPTHQSCT